MHVGYMRRFICQKASLLSSIRGGAAPLLCSFYPLPASADMIYRHRFIHSMRLLHDWMALVYIVTAPTLEARSPSYSLSHYSLPLTLFHSQHSVWVAALLKLHPTAPTNAVFT